MADVKPGTIVHLPELRRPGSQYFKAQQSLRVLGVIENYSPATGVAVITHGGATLRVDTQHLRMALRVGSLYQFIGELKPDSESMNENELMLQARVGRNVDGLDVDLYEKALHIRRQVEAKYLKESASVSSGEQSST